MSVKAFELFGTVGAKNTASAELKKVDRDLAATTSHFRKLGHEIDGISGKGRGLSSSFSGLGFLGHTASNLASGLISKGVGAATDAITQGIEAGREYNRQLEQTMIGMETLLGSRSAAVQHIRDLEQFAFKTPFTSMELFKLSPYLQAVGFDAKQVIPLLRSVGDALAATGNTANLDRVIRQLGQMKSMGVLHFEEMNIIAENGIPAWQMLAEAIAKPGESVEELKSKLMDLGRTGQLMSKDILPILQGQMDKKYGGMMERAASQTQLGVKSNELDYRQKIAAEGIRGTQDLIFTGGAYGAETQRSRDRATALQGQGGHDLRRTIGFMGGVYGAGTDALQETVLKQGLQLAQATDGSKGSWSEIVKGGPEEIAKKFVWYLGHGFADGLEGLGLDKMAEKHLGINVWKILESFWESQSPSKRAERLGTWIAKGLEIGLNKRQAGNYAKLQSLSQQDPEFVKKLVAGSVARGINPDHMLNVLAMESSFNAQADNPNSSAYGLIQFMAGTRKGLGVTQSQLSKMSETQQLDWVFKYFDQPHLRGKLGTQSALYAAVAAGKVGSSDESILFKGGSAGYNANKVWDANRDGMIRQGELGKVAYGALGAGGSFSIAGHPLSDSNPMPVRFAGVTGGAGPVMYQPDPGPQTYKRFTSMRDSGRAPGMIYDRDPVVVEVAADIIHQIAPIKEEFRDFSKVITLPLKPLIEVKDAFAGLTGAAKGLAADLPMGKLTPQGVLALMSGSEAPANTEAAAAAERLRAQVNAAGNKGGRRRRDPLFEKQFTKEGIAGDFQNDFASLLGNMGWEKPTSLLKQFGLGMLKNIQGRLANDMSSMLTGALFGNRKGGTGDDANSLVCGLFGGGGGFGGFFKSIFGKLFGGFRASGGSMSAGRLYIAGENGPELVGGPGHVYNASQTRNMMSGGEQRVIVAVGDRAIGEAIDAYRNSGRGRRARVMQAKYGRKIQAVSY